MEKEKALELFSKDIESGVDLRTIMSQEYFPVVNDSMLQGIPMRIKGDLMEVKQFGVNEIALIVLVTSDHNSQQYARILVKNEDLKAKILSSAKTYTGIDVQTILNTNNLMIFELTEIKELNQPLNFGRWICPDCGTDYGYDGSCKGHYCEICGESAKHKLINVTNFYTEEMLNLIRNKKYYY